MRLACSDSSPTMNNDLPIERRYHPRLPVEFQVRVSVVDGQSTAVVGRLVDISKSGISVLLPVALSAGLRVRVELSDASIVGRVVYANPGSATDSGAVARFRTGIEVEQVSIGSSDLSALLKSLLEEARVIYPIH